MPDINVSLELCLWNGSFMRRIEDILNGREDLKKISWDDRKEIDKVIMEFIEEVRFLSSEPVFYLSGIWYD